jgi:hypothetical protein
MKYSEFFAQIRSRTKDVADGSGEKVSSVAIGRFTLAGLRRLMSMFRELAIDSRGRLSDPPSIYYTEATAGLEVLPIPPEFEPALEAYVLASIYGSDAEDVKDESLFRYWDGKFKELTGTK